MRTPANGRYRSTYGRINKDELSKGYEGGPMEWGLEEAEERVTKHIGQDWGYNYCCASSKGLFNEGDTPTGLGYEEAKQQATKRIGQDWRYNDYRVSSEGLFNEGDIPMELGYEEAEQRATKRIRMPEIGQAHETQNFGWDSSKETPGLEGPGWSVQATADAPTPLAAPVPVQTKIHWPSGLPPDIYVDLRAEYIRFGKWRVGFDEWMADCASRIKVEKDTTISWQVNEILFHVKKLLAELEKALGPLAGPALSEGTLEEVRDMTMDLEGFVDSLETLNSGTKLIPHQTQTEEKKDRMI